MKTISFGHEFRLASVLATSLGLVSIATAQFLPPPPQFNESSTNESFVSYTGALVSIDGDKASFQRMRQIDRDGLFGVDRLRYRDYLDNDWTLTIDARALSGNDYLVHLRTESPDGVYFDAGYKTFRVFYDASGGYVPLNGGVWLQAIDDDRAIDRSKAWFEWGFVKDQVSGKLAVELESRDGDKDSLAWGDSGLTGLSGSSGRRYLVPSFYTIDEDRMRIIAEIEYEPDDTTTVGGGLHWEDFELDNSRNMLRRPGEDSERYVTNREISDGDVFSVFGFVEKWQGEKLLLTGSASRSSLDSNFSGGGRVNGDDFMVPYDPVFANGQNHDHGIIGLQGNGNFDQTVMTGNFLYLPAGGWRVNGGLRFENQDQDSLMEAIDTDFHGDGGPASEVPIEGDTNRGFNELLGSLELTHNGIPNWVFSAFAEASTGDGDLMEDIVEVVIDPEDDSVHIEDVVQRMTAFDRDMSKIGAKARWYPSTEFNGAVGIYHKVRDNHYDTTEDNTANTGSNRFPAFITDQKFSTDDIYVKGTLRPATGIQIVARFDRQDSDIRNREEGLADVLAGKWESNIVSVSATFTVASNLLIQVHGSAVDESIHTGLTGEPALLGGVFENDYTTLGLMFVAALDEKTNIEGEYYYYDTDNFRDVSFITMPYGMTSTDEFYSITLNRRESEDLQWGLRLAHGKYEDVTSGGNNDFDYDMVYGRLQMRY